MTADGFRSVGAVSGDDDNANPGFTALLDRVSDFRSRRVKHANETKQSHVLLQLRVVIRGLGLVQERARAHIIDARQCHHTKTLVTVFNNLLRQKIELFFCKRHLRAVVAQDDVRAAFQDRFRGTLHQKLLLRTVLYPNRHALAIPGELVGGLQGKALGEVITRGVQSLRARRAQDCVVGGLVVRSDLFNQSAQRAFGGFTNAGIVAVLLIVRQLCTVAKSHDLGHLTNRGRGDGDLAESLAIAGELALRRESCAFHVDFLKLRAKRAQVHDLLHTHLVGGQGSCFVGADDAAATQGFHGRQRADDGVLLGHFPGSQSQASGDDHRETFGDGRHT